VLGVLVVVPRASRDAEQRVAESSNGSGLPRIHTGRQHSNPWRIYAANALDSMDAMSPVFVASLHAGDLNFPWVVRSPAQAGYL
jgi:hypothetical protein